MNQVVSMVWEMWPRWDSVIVESLEREFQGKVLVGQKMNVQWEGRELLGQTQMEVITRPQGVSTKPARTGGKTQSARKPLGPDQTRKARTQITLGNDRLQYFQGWQ